MRIRSRLTFWCDNERLAKDILEPLEIKPNIEKGVNIHVATLFVDQPEYRQLTTDLDARGIKYSELKELAFTAEELRQAEYLVMRPSGYWGYPQPEGTFREEVYDTSGVCEVCGRGMRQERPFRMKSPIRFGRNDILTMNWTFEFIVTDRLRKWIEHEDLDGAEFWPLLDYRTGVPISGFFQLYFVNSMPPASPSTRFESVVEIQDDGRTRCNHPTLNLTLSQMKYRRKDLREAKAFNKTHEWLGGGWFAQSQWKVVSHEVYKLFVGHDVKRVRFEPVVVEG